MCAFILGWFVVSIILTLGIQSPCQMMIGVYNHLLSKVFRFHYHSQKVIGSLGSNKVRDSWIELHLYPGTGIRICESFFTSETRPSFCLEEVRRDVLEMPRSPTHPAKVAYVWATKTTMMGAQTTTLVGWLAKTSKLCLSGWWFHSYFVNFTPKIGEVSHFD